MTHPVAHIGRRIAVQFHEFREVGKWSWTQIRNWWVGEEHAARKGSVERRKRKQKQKEILRRLRGVTN